MSKRDHQWAWDNNVDIINVEEHCTEMLSDCFDDIYLCGKYPYPHGDAVKELDPVLFKEVMAEEIDARVEDEEWVLLDDGTVVDAESYEEAISNE